MKISHSLLAALLVTLAPLAAACGGGSSVMIDTQQTYYLQTNLRAHGNKITSINEWDYETLLPICSPVQIERARGRVILFRLNGQRYQYVMHRSSRVDLAAHVNRTFGHSCPDTRTMSQQDQMAIQMGQPVIGMTKSAAILALGYPPSHKTPSLEMSPWTYWGTRGQVALHFNGDMLVNVQGRADEPAVIQANMAGNQMMQPGAQQPVAGQPGQQPVTPAGYGQTGAQGQAQGQGQGQAQAQVQEPTVVVTDAQGYPVQVPQSAIGRACDAQNPCHQALQCVQGATPGAGTCQAAQ